MSDYSGKADLMAGATGLSDSETLPDKSEAGNKDLIEFLRYQFDNAKASRSTYDKDWKTYINFYKGKTWQTQKSNQKAKDKPEFNIIRPVIQTLVPLLTDSKPGFQPIPKTPDQVPFSSMLSEMIEGIWDRQKMQNKIVEVLMDSTFISVGFAKVLWDNDLEDGLGDVSIELVDPENLFVNKGAIDFDRNCKIVIERNYKSVGELRRMFPEFSEKIKPDSSSKDTENTAEQMASSPVTLVSPVDQDKNKSTIGSPNISTDSEKEAEYWECWFPDDTEEEFELAKEDGSIEKKFKKKFPNGRLVSFLPNQSIVLQDVENPYEGPEFNPYVKFPHCIMPREFYGEGAIEPLCDYQKIINKIGQTILAWCKFMSNPVWIRDKNSGVDPAKLTNEIGLIINKEPGTECKRDWPVAMPPHIFQIFDFMFKLADSASGIHDVTQGRKPAGITAAEAIQTLEDAAQTRIRLNERNLQTSLSYMAKKIINMILQYYRGQRWIRLGNDSMQPPSFIDFYIEPMEDNKINITRKVKLWNVEKQAYQDLPIQQAQSVKSQFDVKVVAGTSMPFSKAIQSQKAIQLYDRKALSQEGLLEAFEWPNMEKEKQRLMEQNKAAAEAQKAQMAAVQGQGQAVPQQNLQQQPQVR